MKEKYHASFNVPRHEQGLIYYSCLNHKKLPPKKQIYIINLCIKIGGEYSDALFEAVTTMDGLQYIALQHYMSMSSLWRLVKLFYEAFDVKMFECYYELRDKKQE